jgi:hypothetical protein
MASGRTRSASVPREFLPCGSIDPDNPVTGPMGEERPFDPHASAATRLHNRWLATFDRSVGQEKPEAREH